MYNKIRNPYKNTHSGTGVVLSSYVNPNDFNCPSASKKNDGFINETSAVMRIKMKAVMRNAFELKNILMIYKYTYIIDIFISNLTPSNIIYLYL
jgi:hypothetical protein